MLYDGNIFITGENKELIKARQILNLPPIPVGNLSAAKNTEIVQLMAFGSEEQRSDISLFSKVLTDCEPTSWNPFFCDIVPKGSDKSTGIDAMIKYFGIALSDTVAFGDGTNDIGMLKHCGTGIAMGNSLPSVKAVADFVTTDVTEHGILNAFKYLEIFSIKYGKRAMIEKNNYCPLFIVSGQRYESLRGGTASTDCYAGVQWFSRSLTICGTCWFGYHLLL